MKREDRIKAAMKRIQELKILIKHWSKK